MSTLALSIVVYGPGTDANNRSHWAIALHRSHLQTGTILQVWPIDLSRLIYQLEIRSNTALDSQGPEAFFTVTNIAPEDTKRVLKTISQEPAPSDGVERCQDWVLRAIIALEAEEVVPPGTSSWVSGLIRRAAEELAQAVGSRWTRT